MFQSYNRRDRRETELISRLNIAAEKYQEARKDLIRYQRRKKDEELIRQVKGV